MTKRRGLYRSSGVRVVVSVPCMLLCLGFVGCAYARIEKGIVDGRIIGSGELPGVTIDRPEEGAIVAKVGTALKKEDILQTDANTQIVVAYRSDGIRIVAYPDSKFGIGFFIYWGRVLYQTFVENVDVKVGADDGVEDSHSIAAREGTAFDYQVTKDDVTTCTVLEGRVHMRAKDGSWGPTIIEPFQRMRIAQNQPSGVDTLNEVEREALITEFNRLATLTDSKTAVVPQCVGLEVQAGETQLRGLGFAPARSDELTEDLTRVGQVLEQDPQAGTILKRRKRVRLVVGVRGVRVPDVLTLEQGNAVARLTETSLRSQISEQITGSQPHHTVLHQAPAAGSLVREGSTVRLVIEAPSVEVPSLLGSARRVAQQNLRAVGLNYREIGNRITGRKPQGHVIEQRPDAGQLVPPGSDVSVVVEAPSVIIPSVVGMQAGRAMNALRRVGIQRIQKQTDFAPRSPQSQVIRQNPSAHQRVSPDTPVTIVLADPGVEVPDLRGNTPASAETRLRNLGLNPVRRERQTSDEFFQGKVIEQNPSAGMRVRRNVAVEFWVAMRPPHVVRRRPEPPQQVQVPPLVGLSKHDAEQRLKQNGLHLGQWHRAPNSAEIPNIVTRQHPPHRAWVPRGSAVDVWLK